MYWNHFEVAGLWQIIKATDQKSLFFFKILLWESVSRNTVVPSVLIFFSVLRRIQICNSTIWIPHIMFSLCIHLKNWNCVGKARAKYNLLFQFVCLLQQFCIYIIKFAMQSHRLLFIHLSDLFISSYPLSLHLLTCVCVLVLGLLIQKIEIMTVWQNNLKGRHDATDSAPHISVSAQRQQHVSASQ